MEPRRAAWVTPVGVSPDPRARPEQVTFFRRHVNTSTTNKRFPTIRVLVVSWRLPVPGWVPGWDAGLSLSRWVGKVPEVLGAFPAKESGPARPPPPLFPPMHTGNEGEKSQFFWDRAMPASGKPSPPPSSGQDFGDCLWAAVTGGGGVCSPQAGSLWLSAPCGTQILGSDGFWAQMSLRRGRGRWCRAWVLPSLQDRAEVPCRCHAVSVTG